MHPERPATALLPLALALPFLAACTVAGIVGAHSVITRQPPPAPGSADRLWSPRRAEAVGQLTAHPRDPEAALKLSRILAQQAMSEAQDSYTRESALGVGPYRSYVVAALNRSQELADAEALARHVATTAADA